MSDPSTIGHVSDGIEEYDNPLPRWWLYLFYLTIVFAVVYCVLYPTLPGWPGLLGWSQESQYEHQPALAGVEGESALADIEALAADPAVVASGKEVFQVRCAPCHGAAAEGKIGPSLVDADWKYGDQATDILSSVTKGRSGGMPAWGKVLGKDEVARVSAYVYSLRQP